MLLVAGAPSLRRAVARLAGGRPVAGPRSGPGDLRSSPPAAQRPAPQGPRRVWRAGTSCGSGTGPSSTRGSAVVEGRLAALGAIAEPLARAHAEIAPGEGRLTVRYETNAPRVRRRDRPRGARPTAGGDGRQGAVERRHAGRPAPRRPRLRARRSGSRAVRQPRPAANRDPRDASLPSSTCSPSSTAIRRSCSSTTSSASSTRRGGPTCVRRIADLPQAFVTTTSLDDIDPRLRAMATLWAVEAAETGATVRAAAAVDPSDGPRSGRSARRPDGSRPGELQA